MKYYFRLYEILKNNKKLREDVIKVKRLSIQKEDNICEKVNSLQLDFATHLFIMANFSDLMNIDFK